VRFAVFRVPFVPVFFSAMFEYLPA
jgi:hypothetical protein